MSSRAIARTAVALGVLLTVAACRETPMSVNTELPSPLMNAVGDVFPSADTDQTEGWLVLFNENATPDARQRALISVGANVDYVLRYGDGSVVQMSDASAELLRANPNIDAVYINSVFAAQQAYQTNALYWRRGVQWSMRQIEAHLAATNGTGVRVCVIDGPIPTSHRDFVGKVAASASFPGINNWGPNADALSHGAHVASTVSTNGIGLASVAPGVTLLSANVFGASWSTSLAQVLEAMLWCRLEQADVVNMSLGGPRTRGSSVHLSDVAAYSAFTNILRSSGIVVVASAGNDAVALPSATKVYVPAEAPGVLTVGATGPAANRTLPFSPQAPHSSFDQVGAYSNRNSGANALGPGVRIYAPGGTASALSYLRILGVCNSVNTFWRCGGADTYFGAYGTSMAAPHVSGVLALITQRYLARTRNLARTTDVEACLFQTSDVLPPSSPFYARGRVNARRASTEACPGL